MKTDSRFEVFYREKTVRKFRSDKTYLKEYVKHIGYGASGVYDTASKIGTINSCKKICLELKRKGYTNLYFENGGDDDVVVVDHTAKQFGFFEDHAPILNNIPKEMTLEQIWRKS